MKRALIVSSSREISETIEPLLRGEGYTKLANVSSGNEARRFLDRETEPELIVINTPLNDEFGQQLAETADSATSAGVILLCRNDISSEIADKLSATNVCVIPRPLNRDFFIESVKLLTVERAELRGMTKENDDILTKINEIRLISRAKSTLMKYLHFTEPQAHKYIEKQAMNNRCTRKEVAQKVIAQYEK